jgi:hypothetical protein
MPQRPTRQQAWSRPPQMQLLPMQEPLTAQVRPHAPQLASSSRVFTQRPAHGVWPEGHAQRPAVQEAPVGQTVLHAPQLRRSVMRLVHAIPHTDWPAGHWQVPATQV